MLHSQFDPFAINFSIISKTNKGGKIVFLSFDNNERIKIQTPVLSAPFGVSSYDDGTGQPRSHVLDASFKGYESNAKISAFLGKCRAFDERLLNAATEHSNTWFGKAMSKELVSEFLRRSVREPNDPKYAPTLRMKITTGTEFFSERREPVKMEYVTKGSTFRAILELSSVWFLNKNFGVTWKIAQLAVVSRPDRLTGFAFKGEDEDDYGYGGDDGDAGEI
jgi:hypothetical protein